MERFWTWISIVKTLFYLNAPPAPHTYYNDSPGSNIIYKKVPNLALFIYFFFQKKKKKNTEDLSKQIQKNKRGIREKAKRKRYTKI